MQTTLSNIWFIAKNDVLFSLRDRSTLLWLVLMPPVFFFFIGSMTEGGIGNMMTETEIVLEAAAADDPVGQRFQTLIEEAGFTTVAQDAPRLEIAGPLTGADAPVPVIYHAGEPTPTTDFEALRLTAATLALRAELAVLAARDEGADSLESLAATPRALTVEVETAGRLGRIPTGFEQAIPGMLVMFTMLVLLTTGGTLLLMEREQGMLRRLATAPLSRDEIIAGKWLGRMLLALAQIGFAMVVGTLLFGMEWGSALPMVLIILIGWAAVCASLGLVVGSIGRSQAEAAGLGMLLTMAMAALGGAWWPIEITPDWMQTLQMAVPAGWTMDAIHRLVSFGNTPASVLPHLGAMALTALVFGWVAARVFRFD
ncbi:MAG: ABC transporter permease [Paracoccaceae bacterium]|nr:ABC transporter permease [Paracoccaceae bacterium]